MHRLPPQAPLRLISFVLSLVATGCAAQALETASVPVAPQNDVITQELPVPAAEASPEAADEAAIAPTRTALPIFGRKVENSKLFHFTEQSILTGDDLYSPGEAQLDLTLNQMPSVLGFTPLLPLTPPAGFQLEPLEVFAETKRVRQCFTPSESGHMRRPRLCVSQQATPFQERVGPGANVFQLETASLYIEYVHGGWLGSGAAGGPNRTFQWDNRMVPITTLRLFKENLHVEISMAGHMDCPDAEEGCVGLEELVSLAEEHLAPGSTGGAPFGRWNSYNIVDKFQFAGWSPQTTSSSCWMRSCLRSG